VTGRQQLHRAWAHAAYSAWLTADRRFILERPFGSRGWRLLPPSDSPDCLAWLREQDLVGRWWPTREQALRSLTAICETAGWLPTPDPGRERLPALRRVAPGSYTALDGAWAVARQPSGRWQIRPLTDQAQQAMAADAHAARAYTVEMGTIQQARQWLARVAGNRDFPARSLRG